MCGSRRILFAVKLAADQGTGLTLSLAAIFFVLSMIFVWRSFYGMRITTERG